MDAWKYVARVLRAGLWVGLALLWTGSQTADLVRELRNGPAQEAARRRQLAAELAAAQAALDRPDCLRMMPDGWLCRRTTGHRGPCSREGGTDEP